MVLQSVVGATLEALVDLRRLPPALLDGRAEARLRAALAHQPPTPVDGSAPVALGAAAARTACAYLAAHAWVDALQALHVARDHLDGATPAHHREQHKQDS